MQPFPTILSLLSPYYKCKNEAERDGCLVTEGAIIWWEKHTSECTGKGWAVSLKMAFQSVKEITSTQPQKRASLTVGPKRFSLGVNPGQLISHMVCDCQEITHITVILDQTWSKMWTICPYDNILSSWLDARLLIPNTSGSIFSLGSIYHSFELKLTTGFRSFIYDSQPLSIALTV